MREGRELLSLKTLHKMALEKIRSLLPSLREKKRYIVFEVIPEQKVNFDEVKTSLEREIQQFLGVLGASKAGVIVMPKWNNNKGILRVSNKMTDKVKAAIALIKEISGKKVIVRTLGVSGILKKSQEKYYD